MAKFIEVTERCTGKKHLVAIDKIIYIEDDDGLACIAYFVADMNSSFVIRCAETYVEIFNTFCEFEMI